MKAVFVLWTCDAWHTHSSKRFAGVFDTHELAQKNDYKHKIIINQQ